MALIRSLALLVTLMAGQALAEDIYAPWLPPAQYDHPYEGPGEMRVIEAPFYIVKSLCGVPQKQFLYACAYATRYGCTIILPDPHNFAPRYYKALKRHERGHCNGWPRDHPRGLAKVEK